MQCPLLITHPKNCYSCYFRKNNSSLRVCETRLEDLHIRRNYVFLRRLVGTHSRRFVSPQAHGFTHRCCKHQPPPCPVVKMMKLKFFNSPGIRKLCSSGGVVRWDEVSFYGFSSFLLSYEPHSL